MLTKRMQTSSNIYKVFQKPFVIVNRGSNESLHIIANTWSNLYVSKKK